MVRLGSTIALIVSAAVALASSAPAGAGGGVPTCTPGGPAVELTGSVVPDDAKTYVVLPVDVASGTTRVEVGYEWSDRPPAPPPTPLTQTVLDLGLWDDDGYRSTDGFRGWSGSRQGRIADGQDPVFVQADAAERGYVPGVVRAGRWWVELGVGAVGPTGADWTVTVWCRATQVGPEPAADPVDPSHVARAAPGWYHGDFHMHGFHSNPNAPA